LSAILEALRRAEREAPPRGPQSMPYNVDPRKTFLLRIRRAWFVRRALTLLFVLFVLVSSGWALSKFLPRISRGPEPVIKPAAETGDETRTTQIALEKSEQVHDHIPAEKEGSAEPLSWSNSDEAGYVTSGGKTASKVPRDVKPEKQRSQRPPTGVQEISPVSADQAFKLEALVWSTNPESRFAVISGQIVKLGQSIRGASVTEIERDYVDLKAGDQTWRLRIKALP
jgi:type II secretory pathway component PulC